VKPLVIDVLIAEDEVWIRSAIVMMVEKLGPQFRVVGETGNGEEAWEFIGKHWPSILITDIMMPRKDGLWIAEKIYERQLPMTTIIASGYDNFQYAKQAMRYGISEYLLKPINEEELFGALSRSVQRLESLSDVRDMIGRIQEFMDSLPDQAQQHLLWDMEEIVRRTLRLKSVNPDVRRSLLATFSAKLGELLQGIDAEFQPIPLPEAEEKEMLRHFHSLLEKWIMIFPQFSGNDMNSAVRRICEYIDRHPSHNLPLAEAAEMVHLSVSHFSVLFKKFSGQTYLNYVNQTRIEKAKEYLRIPELKVYEAAERAGFATLPYFNRIFKKAVGLTPVEYRKRLGI
jgi:two-component system response regulator YesN